MIQGFRAQQKGRGYDHCHTIGRHDSYRHDQAQLEHHRNRANHARSETYCRGGQTDEQRPGQEANRLPDSPKLVLFPLIELTVPGCNVNDYFQGRDQCQTECHACSWIHGYSHERHQSQDPQYANAQNQERNSGDPDTFEYINSYRHANKRAQNPENEGSLKAVLRNRLSQNRGTDDAEFRTFRECLPDNVSDVLQKLPNRAGIEFPFVINPNKQANGLQVRRDEKAHLGRATRMAAIWEASGRDIRPSPTRTTG
jgi:hypothetical protein